MARIIHMKAARPGGVVHWLRVSAMLAGAAAAGIGISRLVPEPRPATSGEPSVEQARADVRPELVSPFAPVETLDESQVQAPSPSTGSACAIQRLHVALDGQAAQAACLDATRVRQNGSVRSYVVAGTGTDSWTLQIDVAAGDVIKTLLTARDGRRFACEARDCQGVMISRHDARGARSITLHQVSLPALASAGPVSAGTALSSRGAVLNGSLAVPSDEQVPGLACTGPALDVSTPDGAAHKFCGQGGAGFSIGDDGLRTVQFQDHEGQTLSVALDTQQRVTRIEFNGYACEGESCDGVSVAAAAPDNELSERIFFFGRTALYDETTRTSGRSSPQAPGMVLNGSIVLPSQE